MVGISQEIVDLFEDMNNKDNYRSVSTLSSLSNVFEKLIYSQINTYE